jgi:ribosomal protein L7/L12
LIFEQIRRVRYPLTHPTNTYFHSIIKPDSYNLHFCKQTCMVKIESYCYDCQKPIDVEVSQTVINLCLRWSTSYTCSFCGAMVESDDIGFPPDEIRQSILSEQGEWHLAIEKLEANKVVVMKTLRQTLNLSIIEVKQLLKNCSSSSIQGTQAEMQWLKEHLASEGIQAIIIRK